MGEQRVKGVGALINSCDVATPAKRRDAEIYASMRDLLIKAHCAHACAGPEHVCSGKITITARHVTFQCPLCGDSCQTTARASPASHMEKGREE